MRFIWVVLYCIVLAVDAHFSKRQVDIERRISKLEDETFLKDVRVDKTVGPEDATYCILEDPTGSVVFNGFGQCKLILERVTMEHNGIWNMSLELPGIDFIGDVPLVVNVVEAVVSTRVEDQQPSVMLTCSVPEWFNVRSCNFRDPMGMVLNATKEENSIEDITIRYKLNVSEHECSLFINGSKASLGVWRCGVDIGMSTKYGFLSVNYPWLMEDHRLEDINLEPTLTAQSDPVLIVEGVVTMACIIHAPITYCSFRASNGTEFSVTPGFSSYNMEYTTLTATSTSSVEYVGNGFDAGECGVRFTNLMVRDSGLWSCRVGLVNQTVDESSEEFQVIIEDSVLVRHYWHKQHGLVVEVTVHLQRTLHSCEFLRSDGLAFSSDNIPSGFRLISLDDGHCLLQIEEASGPNLHPWTVRANVTKHGIVIRVTTDNAFWFKQIEFGANVTGQQANGDEFEIQRVWLSRIDRITRIGERIDMSLDRLEQEELCYFISPSGEDSSVDENIAGVTIQEPSTFVSCRITVGPIERSLIGTWTLCGRRTDNVIHERCQHINVTFNNNNNPNAAWQITEHPRFNHSVSLDRYLTPVVIGHGHTRSCHIITPNGEDLVITQDTNYPNLQLVPLEPATMTCSVRIGPIERWMMGEWTLYGKFRRQANNEVRLPMRLSLYDEENPYIQPYNVTNLDTIDRNVPLGRIITLEVSGTGNTDECEYIPPDGQRYLFNSTNHFPGVTIMDLAVVTTCRITIGPIEEQMFGSWEVVGRFSSNEIFTERRQPFYLALGDEDEMEDTEWLPHIQLITRTGQNIDITLSNIMQDEICFFENPRGERGTEKSGISGVRMRGNSRFVSCRITVGPMEQSLIGNWTLCGNYGQDFRYKRCQTVTISWHNNNNPSSNWQVNNQRLFQHSVSLNRFLNPVVESLGSTLSCHIITPDGEDLILTADSQYPRLQVVIRGAACFFTIGPLERWMLGDWTIYGMFSGRGIVENRLPMNLALFDEENPYTQPYNITELNPINRLIQMGLTTTVEVTGSGNIVSCVYRAPSGQVYDFDEAEHFPGVTIPNVGNSVVCRLSVGPIQKQMLGEWQLVGQFRTNNGVFSERRQAFSIVEEDPDNPIIEENREIINLTDRRFDTIIGATVSVSIGNQRFISRETCHIRTPAGRQYIMAEHFSLPGVTPFTNQNVECGVRVTVSSQDMIGEWVLISRGHSSENPVERRQRFVVSIEDPDNPLIEEDREILNLDDRTFDTEIGQTVSVSIGNQRFITRETCHIRTPAGRQYIMAEHFNLPGVTPFNNQNIECGVTVTVSSVEMLGEWVLISRGNSPDNPVERRQRFFLHAEVPVEAFPPSLSIVEGNDLFVRLREPTDEYETCQLINPRGHETINAVNDTANVETCGFVVREVSSSDSGTWSILYGRRLIYRASVNVTVFERDTTESGPVDIIKDVAANTTVGPQDATYCRLEDPTGVVVFDGFGPCRLTLERVTIEHNGIWNMFVGLPGSVLVERRNFVVNVKEAGPYTLVHTSVQRQRPSVVLTCSVPQSYNLRACKFRAPSGEVLIATQGVGEGGYVAGMTPTSYRSNTNMHECALRISNPLVSHLGLWRCAVETDIGTHYGFLSVICPWMFQQMPEVQAQVVTEPVVEAQRRNITTIEGAVTMTCSVNAPISYCYFRARNGTTFSIAPEISTSHLEYVGSGFDAGECGIRFANLVAGDSGEWSCHVGLVDQTVEQRAQFQVSIEEPITVQHYLHRVHGLVVEARVHSERRLRYCRFVRIDGLGFTTDNIPSGYNFIGSLVAGHCLLQIEESTMLNLHPWTIAARISGQTVEISRQTTDNLLWIEPSGSYFPLYLWFVIMFLSLIVLVMGISLGTKKNRKWTFDKASWIRNSVRNSFRKPKAIQ